MKKIRKIGLIGGDRILLCRMVMMQVVICWPSHWIA